MYRRKWKASKTKAKEFAIEMKRIEEFCCENGISYSRTMDSYYFTLNGINYRVSNHTMETSNAHAYNDFGEQVREKYHSENDFEELTCITASKTRIIEIYNNLKDGKILDKRGYIKDCCMA